MMRTRSRKESLPSALSSPLSSLPPSRSPTPQPALRQARNSLSGSHLGRIIVLPLPEYLGGPKRIAPPAVAVPTHSRAFWTRNLSGPGSGELSCRGIMDCLGLRRVDRNARRARFFLAAVVELEKEVTSLAIALPRQAERLVDAACGDALNVEIEDLLKRRGQQVWSMGKVNRPWLLRAREATRYQKDLHLEFDGDRALIAHHLRCWVLVKAANIIRNKTRPNDPGLVGKPIPAEKGTSTTTLSGASSLESRAVAAPVSTAVSPAQTIPPAADDATFTAQNVSPILLPRDVGASRDQASELSHPVTDNALPSQETNLSVPEAASSRDTAPRNSAQVETGDNSFAGLRLDEYWTHKEWSCVGEDSIVTIQDIWNCLGVSNPDAHSPSLTALQVEIRTIAGRLRTHLDPDELLWCAADTKYLHEEIDVLLNEYASRLWGLDAYQPLPQTGLIAGSHRKILIYEQDDDRRVLRLHMNQLVFLEALAPPKGTVGDDEKPEPAHSATGHLVQCVVPARTYEPVASQTKPPAQTKPERKRPFSSDSTKDSDKENSEAVVITSQEPTAAEERAKKTRKVHHNNVVNDVAANTSSSIKVYRGPSALTGSMLEYLNNYGNPTFDESACLSNIDFFLIDLPTTGANNADYTDDFATILTAWFIYRRAITAVEKKLAGSSLTKLNASGQQIQKNALLSQLAQARMVFDASSTVRKDAESILIKGFASMEYTREAGEEIKDEMTTGFKKLDGMLQDLGDRLGDREWLMGNRK
ncbi:hypothetical protein NX059_006165 [Plenodomus lindquistii]|nr:hypothetical protein NX059_006165 [Plenodomus lindquistii]